VAYPNSMHLDLQLSGSHARVAGILAEAANEALLVGDGINEITITGNTVVLKIDLATSLSLRIIQESQFDPILSNGL
jgi:hypothetical protein